MQQFGGKITKQLEEVYQKSHHWKDGGFQNLTTTSMSITLKDIPQLLYEQFFKTKNRTPKTALPVLKFNNEAFLKPSDTCKIIWYGHSAVLLRMSGKNILIDPMLGSDASPIAPFKTKRFSKNTLEIIDQLPEIDLLLQTHDHYDHLDLQSIKRLKPKVKQYFVALGCKRHLKKWGVEEGKIQEFDWWDSQGFGQIKLTFTPSRHFSGRGLSDRAKSLWGGWVLQTPKESLYWSGDGGYGDHFKELGNKFGSFDLAMMECGQYNEKWHQIHLFPEESVQAAIDVNAKTAMPVHWGGFALALHTWKDPINRFVKSAEEKKLPIIAPRIGESCHYNDFEFADWWSELE